MQPFSKSFSFSVWNFFWRTCTIIPPMITVLERLFPSCLALCCVFATVGCQLLTTLVQALLPNSQEICYPSHFNKLCHADWAETFFFCYLLLWTVEAFFSCCLLLLSKTHCYSVLLISEYWLPNHWFALDMKSHKIKFVFSYRWIFRD